MIFAYVCVGSSGSALVLGMSASAIFFSLGDGSFVSNSESELESTSVGGLSPSESDATDESEELVECDDCDDGDSLRNVSRLME